MPRIVLASLFCLALVAGCRDEPQEVSDILPRDPSHAPPPRGPRVYAEDPLAKPMPPPEPEPRGQFDIMITGGMIEVSPLFPRQTIYFHVRNMTDEVHTIQMSGGGNSATVTVQPKESETLQTRLREGTYELLCTLPGHWERGRFETYEPVRTRR